eukprot:891386-Amphidinium_carterae.1
MAANRGSLRCNQASLKQVGKQFIVKPPNLKGLRKPLHQKHRLCQYSTNWPTHPKSDVVSCLLFSQYSCLQHRWRSLTAAHPKKGIDEIQQVVFGICLDGPSGKRLEQGIRKGKAMVSIGVKAVVCL